MADGGVVRKADRGHVGGDRLFFDPHAAVEPIGAVG